MTKSPSSSALPTTHHTKSTSSNTTPKSNSNPSPSTPVPQPQNSRALSRYLRKYDQYQTFLLTERNGISERAAALALNLEQLDRNLTRGEGDRSLERDGEL